MFQGEEFLNNHLVRVPITPNQQGTKEMRDEVPQDVGSQDVDRNGYQGSDLDDFEFNGENDQLYKEAVFASEIETIFFLNSV